MDNRDKTFIWSDGWWIEGNNAWFVCGMSNVLFKVDFSKESCEEVTNIPDQGKDTYRLTPFCLKYGRDIFCIPSTGQSIWIYNLDHRIFTQLCIDKPEGLQIASQFWIWKDMLFIVLANWNKIIEVNIKQKEIKNYHTVCKGETICKSALVEDYIYMTSSEVGRIYQFDLVTKKTRTYILPEVTKRLYTICFDGEKFWLSGYQKEVYIWKKEKNRLITIENFPADFGMNEDEGDKDSHSYPIFNRSIAVGRYIWFIPIHANKIIYVDRETTTLFSFVIYDEDETKESIFLRQLWSIANYLLEYVREERYIGLFSAKSGRILEIDTYQLCYQWKEYTLKDKFFFQRGGIYKKIYCEGIDDILYKLAYHKQVARVSKNINNIGTVIYRKTTGEGELQ